MIVQCAWCQQPQPDKEPCTGKWAYVVTHIICEACLQKEIAAFQNPQSPAGVPPPPEWSGEATPDDYHTSPDQPPCGGEKP